MEEFKKEISEFKDKYPFLACLSDEHLFGIMCVAYFYYDGGITKSQFENMFTDGQYDGEFDFILNDEQSDTNDLVLVQSKSTRDNLSKDKILDIFDRMNRNFIKLRNAHYEDFNDKVKSAYINCYDQKSDLANDCLVLFTAYNPTEKVKRLIESEIQNKRELKNYKVIIYYGSDIKAQISSVNNPKDYIEYASIKYFKNQGKVILENEQGAVVNISAVDLKRLYSCYASYGLFNRNLRFYIRQKKVDEGINRSLKTNREQFWFLNNGIIIGCEDFEFDGTEIKLKKFSIINGAQTTTLIGESQYVERNTDFSVVCKLIKYTSDKFIDEVAEASNSQKPINDRDLIANRYEQKHLKEELLSYSPPIFVEIKRGEKKPGKSKFKEPWQRVKNEDIGQLILSIILQRPATARSNKKSMFSVEATYTAVFRRQHDCNTIVQMLQLKYILDQYIEKILDTLDRHQKGIANNGKYCIMALIGLLIKNEKNYFDSTAIKTIINGSDDKKIAEIIGGDNLSGFLFSNVDDYVERIENLIYELIEVISDKYETEEEAGRTTSYSNFFKTDKTYYTIIVPTVMKKYCNKEKFRKTIQEYLKAFNI